MKIHLSIKVRLTISIVNFAECLAYDVCDLKSKGRGFKSRWRYREWMYFRWKYIAEISPNE